MRSTSGSRTCSIMSRMRWRRARASRSVCARSTSSIWRPTGTTGLSAVIGSWKIIAMVVARSCRRRRSLAVSSSSPTSLMLPRGRRQRALLQQPHHRQRCDGFARAAFADHAQRFALAHLQGDAVDDARPLRRLAEADDEVVDVEDDVGGRCRAHLLPSRCFMRGSSASRAASPIRLTLRIAIDSNRPGQKISDGLI